MEGVGNLCKSLRLVRVGDATVTGDSMGSFSFKEWYDQNGERLNQKRKDRYENDLEYRAKVLATNQASRQKRREEQAKNPKPRVKKTPEERFKPVELEVNGKVEKVLTIGALAHTLGCSIQAIRLWEKQSVIPRTKLRSKGKTGDRLYTTSMVEQIRRVLTEQGRIGNEPRVPREPRALKRYVCLSNGKTREVQLFLIGALAKAVDRNVATLEQMESKGHLPETPFRSTSVGRRLYTTEMIEAVQYEFNAREERNEDLRGETAWKSFYDDVLRRWTHLKVIGAYLVETLPEENHVQRSA